MTPLQSGFLSAHLRCRRRSEQGVSLLETAIVLALMMVAAGITFISLRPVMTQIKINNAYNTTMMTMRRAREEAIGQRRTYIVTFNNGVFPNTVSIAPASVTPGGINMTYSLPAEVQFIAQAGYPNPGPDGFGNGATAIDFDQNVAAGNKTAIFFNPDGSAQDINNNINNGVVYLGIPGNVPSATAITLWGATGRLRGWRIVPAAGVTPASWRQQ